MLWALRILQRAVILYSVTYSSEHGISTLTFDPLLLGMQAGGTTLARQLACQGCKDRVQRQGAETRGRRKSRIRRHNLWTLQMRYSPNQASSKSDILQTNTSKSIPPNQHLQIKHPPNHASSLHPTIVWPFPSRGREFDSSQFLAQDLTIWVPESHRTMWSSFSTINL